MESAPDTVARNVLLSQQTGATAVVTADAQVPMITGTLSTFTSFCAARTAASGLVSSSSTTSSILRPSNPPAPLMSFATACIAFSMRGPSKLPAPVSGVSTPKRKAPSCARATPAPPSTAAAVPSNPRRVMRTIGTLTSWLFGRRRAEEDTTNLGIGGKLGCHTIAVVAAVDKDARTMGDVQRHIGVLLHHRNRDARPIDLPDRGKQRLRSDRRQPSRRFVQQQ